MYLALNISIERGVIGGRIYIALSSIRTIGVPQLRVEVIGPNGSYGSFGVVSPAAALQSLSLGSASSASPAHQRPELAERVERVERDLSIPVTFLVSVNKVEVTYLPRLSGPYHVHVNYNDSPVIGSPFHVQVTFTIHPVTMITFRVRLQSPSCTLPHIHLAMIVRSA